MLLHTAVPPSYRVVPMADTRDVLYALSQPTVSAVQLSRRGTHSHQLWRQDSEPADRADTRVSLSVGAAAASDTEVVALLDASFAQAPAPARSDMLRLLRLFARCALEEGGASADTRLAVRLVVSDGAAGACSQLHLDNVALRLSCAYHGTRRRIYLSHVARLPRCVHARSARRPLTYSGL